MSRFLHYWSKPLNPINRDGGVTLLELLVAITISGVVLTLGLTMYGYVTKNFWQQTRAVERLHTTMLVKQRIDRTIGRISSLAHATEREVRGTDGVLDSIIICRFSGTALLVNNDTVATGLTAFRFSVVESPRRTGRNNAVLLWDGELMENGDWIGGAVAMTK